MNTLVINAHSISMNVGQGEFDVGSQCICTFVHLLAHLFQLLLLFQSYSFVDISRCVYLCSSAALQTNLAELR